MAFGNPYGDEWNSDVVIEWTKKLANLGIEIIALSDTIGVSNPENISYLFKNTVPEFSNVEIGAHLHTTPTAWEEKVDAAYKNGCRRFDGAIKGFGGCPMATDDLTGNMATEHLITYLNENNIETKLKLDEFKKSFIQDIDVFPS